MNKALSFRVLLLSGLLALLCFEAFPAEAPRRKVRVGYGALPGYHEQTRGGRRAGYGYEYLQHLGVRANWDFEYVGYDKGWAELLAMLERGEIDLVSCVSKTPEREAKFAFSARPAGLSYVNLTVKAEDRRFRPGEYAAWSGMRAGMVRVNAITRKFEEWTRKNGVRFTPVFFDSDREAGAALQAGRIDALVSTNFRRQHNEWLLERIAPDPIFFAARKDNSTLMAELDRAHAALAHDNPFLHQQLVARYYPELLPTLFRERELQFIADSRRNRTVFRALLAPDRFPLVSSQNGRLDGIQYNILQKIIARTELDIRILPCRTHQEYRKLRASGQYEILLDARYDFGYAEANGLLLCNPYLATPISRLTRKNASGGNGKTALLAGSNLADLMLQREIDPSEILYCSSIGEVAEAVKTGAASAACLYTRTCNELIRLDSSYVLASKLVPDLRMEYAVAIRKTAPRELFAIFNRAIAALSAVEREDSVAGYDFKSPPEITLDGLLRTHPVEVIWGLLFLLILVSAVFGYVLISRRKLYRNAKILERLPLRFFVADRNSTLLLANAPDVSNKAWKKVSELDKPEVTQVMEKAIAAAFRDGECRVDYKYGPEKRSAVATRLPASIFGRETAVWISQDTTALHDARAEAVDLAARMRLNIQSIGDAVMVTDARGRIEMMNPVAEALCGVSEAEAKGRPHEEIFRIVNYENDAPVPSPVREVISVGRTVALANHTDLIAADGSRRHIADSAAPVPSPEGGVAGVILVFRDVTGEYDKRDRLKRAATLMELGSELTNSATFEYDFHANRLTGSPLLDRLWPRNGDVPIPRKNWILREDLGAFNAAFRNLRNGTSAIAEMEFRSMYGGELHFYRLKGCVDRTDVRAPKIVGVLRDITEQSGLMQMEHARSLALEVFFSSSDIRTAFGAILKILADYTGAVFCCVLKRKAPETSDLTLFSECRKAPVPPVWTERETIRLESPWLGQQTLRDGGMVYCPDLEAEPASTDCAVARKLREDCQLRAVFLAGLYQEGELWGELGIMFNAPQRKYDRRHEEFLLSFARLLETMIARDSMEYRLRESLTSLELASELVNSAAFVYDVETKKLTGSQQLDRLWPQRDGKCVLHNEWVHPDDLPKWDEAYRQLCAGKHGACTVDLRTDWFGRRRYYSVRGTLATSTLERPKIIGVLTDVSDYREKLFNELHLKRCLEILFDSTMHEDSQREMLQIIAEYMEATRCEIVRMDFSDYTAQTVAEYFTPEAGALMTGRNDLYFEPQWGAVQALMRGETVLMDNLDEDSQQAQFPIVRTLRRERDIKSTFMTGIYLDGRLWGEIEIIYEGVKARPFTENQRGFLRSAAHIVELLLLRRQSEKQLKQALTEAQSAARAKSYFLATMSHEIRTPLNAVIGFAELLKDRSVSPEQQREYLGDIAVAGNALLLLINDVLDLSKLESGQMKFVRDATNFPELVVEVENIFRAKLLEKGLAFRTELAPMPVLNADKLRLRQILFNLIGNAVKFTERGEVAVRGEFVPGTDDSGTLRFAVEDTGCGIPESDRERIFQPFVQSEAQRGTRVGNSGTGLGLAIIRQMLAQMEGSIAVESTCGRGSIFRVEIRNVPCLPSPDGAATPDIGAPADAAVDSSLRLLLVDDVPMNLKVMAAMCRKLGLIHVETAGDGDSALEKLHAQPFDAVLTDMWMPGMSGAELAEKIRADREFQNIRIFAVTADVEARNSFDLHNFTGVLLKPITMDKLVRMSRLVRNSGGGGLVVTI